MQTHEITRLAAFLSTLLVLSLAEFFWPKRVPTVHRGRRACSNLTLALVNSAMLRAVPAISAVGAAVYANHRQWGILSLLGIGGAWEFIATFVLFDLFVFGQHVLMHRIPLLWRLHETHHLDLDLDATSGVRFHPFEMLLSMVAKCLLVLALGSRSSSVAAFEALLNAASLFSHANLRIWPPLERRLRWLLVTPDWHRVHHSVDRAEQNSNFGFFLSIWDRLFRTVRDQPRVPHETLPLGLAEVRDEADAVPILALLLAPFKKRWPR